MYIPGLGGQRRSTPVTQYDYDLTGTTLTDLNSAVTSAIAAPGDKTIGMPGGVWADWTRAPVKTNGRLRLVAKSLADPPIFRAMNLNDSTNVTLDGINFVSTSTDSAGFPNTLGLSAFDTTGMIVRRGTFTGFQWQINATRASGLTIEYNRFGGFAVDSVRLYAGVRDVLVQNNEWLPANLDTSPGQGGLPRNNESDRHSDALQWSCNGTDEQARNVTIRWNRVLTANHYQQVFFGGNGRVRSGASRAALGFLNFSVLGNYIEAAHSNAITASYSINFQIRGNCIRRRSGGNWDWQTPQRPNNHIPTVTLEGTNDGQISNNVYPRDIALLAGGDVTDFTRSGNQISATAFPTTDADWIGMPLVGPENYAA